MPRVDAPSKLRSEKRSSAASRLHVTEARVVPTWSRKRHLYSCAYVYPHGRKIVLTVKELSNEQQTTAYYDAIRKHYGGTQQLFGLGQGAWALENDDIVVRK